MKETSLTILLLTTIMTYGQSPFPTASDSVTWTVCHTTYSPVSPSWYSVTRILHLTDWTNICGQDYSIVQGVSGNNVFIRNDSARVYLRRGTNCSDKEYLIYDFSLNLGDTVICGWRLDEQPYVPDTTKFWVVQVDTVNQERVLTVEYDANYPFDWVRSMTWTTGYGSNEHPFYPISTALDYCECSQQTICLVDYGLTLNSSCLCDTIVISVPEVVPTDFRIFPNPTSREIFIQTQDESLNGAVLTVFEVNGKEVLTTILNTEKAIDLSNCNTGLYLLVIESKNGTIWRKKIIKN